MASKYTYKVSIQSQKDKKGCLIISRKMKEFQVLKKTLLYVDGLTPFII